MNYNIWSTQRWKSPWIWPMSRILKCMKKSWKCPWMPWKPPQNIKILHNYLFMFFLRLLSWKCVFTSKKRDEWIKVIQYMVMLLIWCCCHSTKHCVLLVNFDQEKGHWPLHGLPSLPIMIHDYWSCPTSFRVWFSPCFTSNL